MKIMAVNTITFPILFSASAILLLLILLLEIPQNTNGDVLSNKVVPRCQDGCHCLGADEIGGCPALPPSIEENTLKTFRALTHTNPLFIKCDPFQSKNCVITLEEGEACTVELIAPELTTTESCPIGYSYRLQTVPSLDESIAAGSYITHTGPCGTCSSLEDLAIMIEYPNLPYKGYQCFWTSNGMADLNAAVSCYQDIGFTLSCARTLASYQNNIVDEGCGYECSAWAYDGEAGGTSCAQSSCEACLDDHDINKQFQLVAGRTYANSGYPSMTARQCSAIAPIDVIGGGDICLAEPPVQTTAPSIAPVIPQTVPPTPQPTTLAPVPIATAAPINPTAPPTSIVTAAPINPTAPPTSIVTAAPINPTAPPASIVTAAPINPTAPPASIVTAAPINPTAPPASIITAFPTSAPVLLPTSSLRYQQCLNTAAIEVRMGALSGGSGVICDCTNAEKGETNIPICYSSTDRNQDTICSIQFGECLTVSDCCAAGTRTCRNNICRTAARQGLKTSLRLSTLGGAARNRVAYNENGTNRRKTIRGRV